MPVDMHKEEGVSAAEVIMTDDVPATYIDENSNTYDYGNLGSYSEWANKILNESSNEYPTMPNCGA